jgi:sulfur carrier protein
VDGVSIVRSGSPFVYRHPRADIHEIGLCEPVNARGPFPQGWRLELSGRILFNRRAAALPCRLRELSLTTHTHIDREIVVNGDSMATRATNLAELIAELGFAGKRIATARNGDFVAEDARKATAIERGDRIEIVSPRHGG